jgi:hypothetical protein
LRGGLSGSWAEGEELLTAKGAKDSRGCEENPSLRAGGRNFPFDIILAWVVEEWRWFIRSKLAWFVERSLS